MALLYIVVQGMQGGTHGPLGFSGQATGVQVTGFLGATQLYQNTFAIQFGTSQFFTANWTGIDRLEFSSRPNPGQFQQFVMDDIYFSRVGSDVVPEPATMTLLATGLAGMAAARRKKRKV